MNRLFSCIVTVCLLSINASRAQVSVDSVAAIAQKIRIPGLQVVHATKGEIHSYYSGVLKHGEDNPVNNETAFQAASLTKVVAAYAFFKLYDEGKIELDKPLYSYYQYDRLANNSQGQKITARHVLTHRTGLLNWEGNVSTQEWRESPLHSQFEPGTKYMYSGEGFYYLQLAMEAVSGKVFDKLIEDYVLNPLGMYHSQIVWKDTLLANLSYAHLDEMRPRSIAKYRSVNAAYTLYTTAEDYTVFIQKALNKGIGLRPETHKLMISKANEVQKGDQPSPDDAHVPIALGMRLQYNEAGTWLWHTGSNPGFRCFFITNPETGESLAAFMNAETGFQAMPLLMKLFLGDHQTYWAYLWREGELD
ncbi:MAG: beta-lactamase family protein [Chitinophagaceae bacterium]|nr:beta-lactamase family protein [Chitinophagaceae bacterium]